MSQFYMQRDADGFGAKLATALTADDDATKWIMVTIAADNDIDFKQNFAHYQIHDDGTVVRGGDSAVTVEALNQRLATALDTVEAQAKQLKQLNTLLPQVQQMVTSMTQAQAQSDATVKQLQQLGMQLTQQFALLQVGTTTQDATTTDTTKGAE